MKNEYHKKIEKLQTDMV